MMDAPLKNYDFVFTLLVILIKNSPDQTIKIPQYALDNFKKETALILAYDTNTDEIVLKAQDLSEEDTEDFEE